MKTIFFLLLFSMTLSPRCFAMGEGERVVGWWINSVSMAAAIAQIEVDRARIQANYELKKAQLRLDIERDRSKSIRHRLDEELAFTQKRIVEYQSLLDTAKSLDGPSDAIFKSLNSIRFDEGERSLNIQIFVETLRQEKILQGEEPGDVGALLTICEKITKAGQFSASCEIVKLLSEDPSVRPHLKEFSLTALRAASEKFNGLSFSRSREQAHISNQIRELKIYIEAINARIQEMDKKK